MPILPMAPHVAVAFGTAIDHMAVAEAAPEPEATDAPSDPCVACGASDSSFAYVLWVCETFYTTTEVTCSGSGNTCSCNVYCSRTICVGENCATQDAGGDFSFYCAGLSTPDTPDIEDAPEVSVSGGGYAPPEGGSKVCNIWVGASPVIRADHQIGWHLFVIHYDERNRGKVIAGQPDHDKWSACFPFGHILVEEKDIIGVPSPSVNAMSDESACDKLTCLESEMARINAAGVCYGVPSPNSNSVAYSLLTNCGIPAVKPAVHTAGWGVLI
jgi:hypothetical protein